MHIVSISNIFEKKKKKKRWAYHCQHVPSSLWRAIKKIDKNTLIIVYQVAKKSTKLKEMRKKRNVKHPALLDWYGIFKASWSEK